MEPLYLRCWGLKAILTLCKGVTCSNVNLLSLLFQFGDRSSQPIEGQKRVAFHVYLTESYISLVKVCASYNSLLKANA